MMGNRNIRKFIDLVRKVSGKWTNWDPPIPVTVIVSFFLSIAISVKMHHLQVGAYGSLDGNGEFNVDGNIYSDEFQKYLDDHNLSFIPRDHPPKLAEPDQDYIVASSGVTRGQFDVQAQA